MGNKRDKNTNDFELKEIFFSIANGKNRSNLTQNKLLTLTKGAAFCTTFHSVSAKKKNKSSKNVRKKSEITLSTPNQ